MKLYLKYSLCSLYPCSSHIKKGIAMKAFCAKIGNVEIIGQLAMEDNKFDKIFVVKDENGNLHLTESKNIYYSNKN